MHFWLLMTYVLLIWIFQYFSHRGFPFLVRFDQNRARAESSQNRAHLVQKKTYPETNQATAEPGYYITWLEQNLATSKKSQIRTIKTSTKTDQSSTWSEQNLSRSKPGTSRNSQGWAESAGDMQTWRAKSFWMLGETTSVQRSVIYRRELLEGQI